MKYLARGLTITFALAVLSGCATSRSRLTLDVPSPGSAVVSGGKPIVIDAVRDARTFEADPNDPSTPSLKKGAGYRLDAEQRKQAIARKRGGFGHAFGDILLQSGNVESLTRELVVNALASRGYSVVPSDAAPSDAPHVSVDIRQFWAWFTPGMWSASIEARVETLLDIADPKGKRQLDVKGYGYNAIQVARDANWQLAYERAFKDYLKQFDQAAANNGL
ncbi:hypothetical protein [Frateuria soli]|uniref:hypothetical protein n=1 Tax=Frateuria soli TaxID=1542730 RepID=UPI001E2825D3|nr:hypothetical protein [Frateuria soli]UGB39656.1 hypothetical protein LQ771_07450 [Frateuria soli]